MKRSVYSFLKILNLHKLTVDEGTLNATLLPCEEEGWLLLGTLQRDELRLYAASVWCDQLREKMQQEGGIVKFCDEEQRWLLESICTQKNNNSTVLATYKMMCNLYLSLLLHERLEVEMTIALMIYQNFEVRYYEPETYQPAQPVANNLPDFISN